MRKILSVICIVLLTVGIAFSQSNETKTPATSTTNIAKPKTTTTNTSGDSSGSTATKGNPNTSTSQTGTKTTTTNTSGNSNGSTATKGNPSTTSNQTSTTTTTPRTTNTSVTTEDPNAETITSAKASNFTLDHFIVGGGLSVGGTLSSDIISTGALLNGELEFMAQFNHHRIGIGFDKTLMLNLRQLATVIVSLGESNCNLTKVYLTYEWTLFKRSPINFTAGVKFGSFDVGKSHADTNGDANTKTPIFASAGIAFEIGHPRFLLYIKPEIGFHSYDTGSFRKDIFAMATVGFRWKTKRLDKYESLNTTTETGKKFE